ncbi:NAD/FAD-binding protein, partial [Rhizobium leguminosarum]
NNCYFAGAWKGYGFHKAGLVSGLAAAEALGVLIPWRAVRPSRQPQPDAAA